MRRGVRRGCVRLRGAVVGIDDEDDSTFTVTVDNKTFHFQVKLFFLSLFTLSKVFTSVSWDHFVPVSDSLRSLPVHCVPCQVPCKVHYAPCQVNCVPCQVHCIPCQVHWVSL